MALFCQVFESMHVFSVNEWKEMHEMSPKTGKRVRYYVRDWIANNGSLKTTLKYDCDAGGDAPDMRHEMGGIIENAYNTVMKDFHVDLFNNLVGYVPRNFLKKLMKDYVIYDKSTDKDCYEDRGFKHLYEGHHDCKKKQYCEYFSNICTRDIMTVRKSNIVNISVATDYLTQRPIIRDTTIIKSKMKR